MRGAGLESMSRSIDEQADGHDVAAVKGARDLMRVRAPRQAARRLQGQTTCEI